MRQFIALIAILIFAQTIHAQSISGKMTDGGTGEGLPFANVILFQKGIQITGTTTDLDGNYTFTNVKSGTYDVEFVYIGYPNKKIPSIKVKDAEIEINIEMAGAIRFCCCCHLYIPNYAIPLINLQNTSTGQTLHSPDIKRRF